MADQAAKPQNQLAAGQTTPISLLRQQTESSVTRIFDEVYQEEQALTENRPLAEEMLALLPEAMRKKPR
jgi:hypothetical protein